MARPYHLAKDYRMRLLIQRNWAGSREAYLDEIWKCRDAQQAALNDARAKVWKVIFKAIGKEVRV